MGAAPGIMRRSEVVKFELLQNELLRCFQRFRAIELESRSAPVVPEGAFLGVRLDGIKISKRLLKNRLTHPDFDEALARATATTYRIWRGWTTKENRDLFVGASVVSDEVTLFLDNRPNFFDQRICKIVTSLAGTLSSAMTLEHQRIASASQPDDDAPHELLAFDARPLILHSLGKVREYVRWRWLLSCRNAMCKVLRLRSELADSDIYDTDLYQSISRAALEIERHGLWPAYQDVATFKLMAVPGNRASNLKPIWLPSAPRNPNRRIALFTKAYRMLHQ